MDVPAALAATAPLQLQQPMASPPPTVAPVPPAKCRRPGCNKPAYKNDPDRFCTRLCRDSYLYALEKQLRPGIEMQPPKPLPPKCDDIIEPETIEETPSVQVPQPPAEPPSSERHGLPCHLLNRLHKRIRKES